jgi:hypothetical protein
MGGETFEKEDISMDIFVEEVSKWSLRQNWAQPSPPFMLERSSSLHLSFLSFFCIAGIGTYLHNLSDSRERGAKSDFKGTIA